MDDVALTRAQIKTLAKNDEDVTITARHMELGMIFVERTKKRGERGEGKWMMRDGKYQKS